jgi:hypothetical protein
MCADGLGSFYITEMTQTLYAHMNKIKIKKKPQNITDTCIFPPTLLVPSSSSMSLKPGLPGDVIISFANLCSSHVTVWL